MRIDIGTPEPWVDVEPFGPSRAGETICAGFAVRCGRCRDTDAAYLPVIREYPAAISDMVAKHNRCLERAS